MSPNFTFARFLIVDDNPIDALIITRVLQKAELVTQVDRAESVEAALSYLEACQSTKQYPEVILLDVDMPIRNGFDFLNESFAKGLLGESSVKIIMLTSSSNPADKQQAEKYPLAGYLQKPLKLECLRAVLQLI